MTFWAEMMQTAANEAGAAEEPVEPLSARACVCVCVCRSRPCGLCDIRAFVSRAQEAASRLICTFSVKRFKAPSDLLHI